MLLAAPLAKLGSPEFSRAQRVHIEISTLQVRDVTRCVCVWLQVFALPRPVEDFVLAATKINSYAIYVILLALLLGISSVRNL